MKRLATAPICVAFALLTFFQFPGHTWLQQDTQIYAPILEHLREPSVLRNDILVQQPHLAYTLYDEAALVLRRVTGVGFEPLLQVQQIAARALGFWGLLLLAEAIGLGFGGALTVAAICSLGSVVAGPSVLLVEYEPTPRAFALPLVLLAAGFGSQGRYRAAGIAAGIAMLYHAPTALAFWAIWAVVCAWPGKARSGRLIAFAPLVVAAVILRAAAQSQPETQALLAHLSPSTEMLQRLRASYVFVSTWPWPVILHHVLLFGIVILAFLRLRASMGRDLRAMFLLMPVAGLLSMPLSYLLLEQAKWAAIPQLQPMRTLLFVTLAVQFLCAVAGFRAKLRAEAAIWFAMAFLPPLQPLITGQLVWTRIAMALALGIAAAFAGRWTPAVALVAFFAIPAAGVVNYPRVETPELSAITEWARTSTRQDAVFLFADSPRGLHAGVLRAEALRAIYVDWKGGGQVNYLPEFGEQWWFRWQQTLARKFSPADLPRYAAFGIRYVVLQPAHRIPGIGPVYENPRYLVYELAR